MAVDDTQLPQYPGKFEHVVPVAAAGADTAVDLGGHLVGRRGAEEGSVVFRRMIDHALRPAIVKPDLDP